MEQESFYAKLLWLDLETSGLDPTKHKILEIACILTDLELKNQEEGPEFILQCEEEHLKKMDQWCLKTHKESGLYKSSLESKLTLEEAENKIMEFLKTKKIQPKQLSIAGNSVQFDKIFLFNHMKQLNEFLHFTIYDASSVRKFMEATMSPLPRFEKKYSHRAMDDIKQSIGEIQHYMKLVTK